MIYDKIFNFNRESRFTMAMAGTSGTCRTSWGGHKTFTVPVSVAEDSRNNKNGIKLLLV